MPQFYQDSIFWVELDKIHPNPYQPRKEFDEGELQSLADSIRQYGVLQALVVTRNEEEKEDGGLAVYYELISGERRLRAAKLAGVKQVPVIIRTGEESQQMKLELAIIENVQREDLNPVDRARAFQRLIDDFGFSHNQVAQKVGKSREYITNNLRVLSLPQEILDALSSGKLAEGHARPLMMLNDRPEEQQTLFKEIVYKKMSVREAERVARKIAADKQRKKGPEDDPRTAALEKEFSESLGTRVHIERREQGGKLSIDFFSDEDLQQLLEIFKQYGHAESPNEMMERFIANKQRQEASAQEATTSEAEQEAPVDNSIHGETGNAVSTEPTAEDSARETGTDHNERTATEAHADTGAREAVSRFGPEVNRGSDISGDHGAERPFGEAVAESPEHGTPDIPSEKPEQTDAASASSFKPDAEEPHDGRGSEGPLTEPSPASEAVENAPLMEQQTQSESVDHEEYGQKRTESGGHTYWQISEENDAPQKEQNGGTEGSEETSQQQNVGETTAPSDQNDNDDELYSIRNFTV